MYDWEKRGDINAKRSATVNAIKGVVCDKSITSSENKLLLVKFLIEGIQKTDAKV